MSAGVLSRSLVSSHYFTMLKWLSQLTLNITLNTIKTSKHLKIEIIKISFKQFGIACLLAYFDFENDYYVQPWS